MAKSGLRSVVLSFSARSLTHFGGVYLLHRFFARLDLKRTFSKTVRFPQRNTRYGVGELLLALLYPMLLGWSAWRAPTCSRATASSRR